MGMGGGTLLIPLLVLVLNMEQVFAQSINLFAFLPMAIFALILHTKNGLVDYKSTWLICVLGVGFACLGAYLATNAESEVLRLGFGAFLVVLGMYQISEISHTKANNNQIHCPKIYKKLIIRIDKYSQKYLVNSDFGSNSKMRW